MLKRILNVCAGEDTYGTDHIDKILYRDQVVFCDISFHEFPYPDQTFDEIYECASLQFPDNTKNFFKESWRVLEYGGKLRVIEPNIQGIEKRNATHANFVDRFGNDFPVLNTFTLFQLRNLFQYHGFHDVKAKYTMLYENPKNKNPIWLNMIQSLSPVDHPFIDVVGIK